MVYQGVRLLDNALIVRTRTVCKPLSNKNLPEPPRCEGA